MFSEQDYEAAISKGVGVTPCNLLPWIPEEPWVELPGNVEKVPYHFMTFMVRIYFLQYYYIIENQFSNSNV